MRRHHNTLYVSTEGAYVAAEGETVVVRVDGAEKFQAPLHLLEGVVCFGRVSVSPALMARCSERGIGISFLSSHGRFLARVHGPVSGNVLLRRAQYRFAEDPTSSARAARACLIGKVTNCRAVLLRACRDYPEAPSADYIRIAAQRLGEALKKVRENLTLDSIRGLEGDAARTYFEVFDHLILAQKADFYFHGRNRRPPLDNVNALLSFVYTLLTHDACSALEAVGLDPQVGYLHRDRPGRPGLGLDLVEELRPVIADRLVLTLINRKQVDAKGFSVSETGGVTMTDDTRKSVLVAYQERKREEYRHPYLEESTTLGMLVHLQALLFARFVRGDLDDYPSFIWR